MPRERFGLERKLCNAPGKIRTCDLPLRRRALYPLSYGRRRHRTDAAPSLRELTAAPAALVRPRSRSPTLPLQAMDLSIFFAGTGGSVPSPRRGLPAILVRRGGERMLFDCGEGTQRQLVRSIGLVDVDSVFITHFHADHWLGLPGMLKSLRCANASSR